MERRQQLGDIESQYAVPKTPAGLSVIRLLEIRPNSGFDTPCPRKYSSCPARRSAHGLSGKGTGPYIQDDDMLGRAAVPCVHQLQFAATFIRKEKLAPPQA